jgi:CRISPR-associated protein Cas2
VIVVAYDISDDRRRARLHDLLLASGEPVQASVFECDLSDAQERAMKRKVARIAPARRDRVRFFRLCQACAGAAEDLARAIESPPCVIVVSKARDARNPTPAPSSLLCHASIASMHSPGL